MKPLVGILLWLMVELAGTTPAALAGPWVFALADTVTTQSPAVRLSDLADNELPAAVGALSLPAVEGPGNQRFYSRRDILRRLVTNGLAAGVSFRGAAGCLVQCQGQPFSADSLNRLVRRLVQPLVPSGLPGAPAPWFELELPTPIPLGDLDPSRVTLVGAPVLEAGRNRMNLKWETGGHQIRLPVTVVLHQFAETARARMKIKRGEVLTEDLFTWEWTDLALPNQKTDFHGREALSGVSCSRTLRAGDYLRQNDLKATALVLTGDHVELQVQRGGLLVSVAAVARQAGALGQTIPVRNVLTKRLVNARVVGPGLVKWRN